jgi:hypothetical protein
MSYPFSAVRFLPLVIKKKVISRIKFVQIRVILDFP